MKDSTGEFLHYEVAVIGAGFAGLATAIRLIEEGRDSFIMFERAAEPGGTWRDNVYPGCACDIQSHLYSLSGNQKPDWSRQFPPQAEILNYLRDTVARFSLHEKIRYNTEITALEFDAGAGRWTLRARDGFTVTARVVVMAIGILNRPHIPNIAGLKNFQGELFHSSTWNYDYDLRGKRVAVIGTGASAIQFVPHVARTVETMFLFQRSAPWIIPKGNRRYLRIEKFLFRVFPGLLNWSRKKVFWLNELRGQALLGNTLMRFVIERVGRFHIWRSMRDPVKRELVQPRHRFGCKRVLLSNDYYPALDRRNVTIITQPIREIQSAAVVTADGGEHPVDAIILGTGFVSAELHADLTVRGLNGRELLSEWHNSTGPEAYLGTTISGYPNLVMLLGPNTGLGHNSVVYMVESQVDYLSAYLRMLGEASGAAYLNVRAEVQDAYNRELTEKLADSVWASGCTNWYATSAGKNAVIWPEGAHRFQKRTRSIVAEHYERVLTATQPRISETAPVA